jgi:hypothetical protein
LNLNFLLLTDHRDVLVNLFTSWGVKIDRGPEVGPERV